MRIGELYEEPINGTFDVDHLKAIHAHIFQDLPLHRPGRMRSDTSRSWIKHRALEGRPLVYDISYGSRDVEACIAMTLDQFTAAEPIGRLTLDAAADRIWRHR